MAKKNIKEKRRIARLKKRLDRFGDKDLSYITFGPVRTDPVPPVIGSLALPPPVEK
jgi:hypothetical protein